MSAFKIAPKSMEFFLCLEVVKQNLLIIFGEILMGFAKSQWLRISFQSPYARFCNSPLKIPSNVRTMSHIKINVINNKRIDERIKKIIARVCIIEKEIGKFAFKSSKILALIFMLAMHIAANGKLIAHHEILKGQHFLA